MSTNSLTWIATAAEMRELEQRTVSGFGISEETLMENAGLASFDALCEMAEPGAAVAVVCGKGNNGGDGLVVARLAREAGYDVHLFMACREGEGSELSNLQLRRAMAVGLKAQYLDDPYNFGALGDTLDWEVLVDALLGTGAKGKVQGIVAEAIFEAEKFTGRILSLDIPSGVECDTGAVLGSSLVATRTVTFGLPKPFLFQGEGVRRSGQWTVADIGFPEQLLRQRTGARMVTSGSIRLPLDRPKDSHKGDSGHILIVAGSRLYRGAATLAALGALRAGAGLVTVAGIEPVLAAVASQLPEAILLPLPEDNGTIAADAATTLKMTMSKVSGAVFGPGLTTGANVFAFLEELWNDWWVPSVIDADALNLVSEGLALPPGLNILTPHPGEAARLLGCSTSEVQAKRFEAARALLDRYGWPVLLKGAYSVSCLRDEPLIVNPTGNPGMAAGGMGDVLSGVVAAILAQSSPPDPLAGVTGACWHGLAGDLCAKELGEIGFSASDLAHFLPRARSILST